MSKRLRKKAAFLVVVEVACLILLGVFLMGLQTSLSVNNQKTDIQEKISQMQGLIDQADETAAQNTASYDEVYQSKATSVAYMAQKEDFEFSDAKMKELADMMNITNLLILDKDGNVQNSAVKSPADFTYERYNQLRTVFDTDEPSEPFQVQIGEELRRFYGAKINNELEVVVENDPYELTDILDNTSSWRSILSKISVGLEGYAFAVSSQDYTFQYHPNDALIGHDSLTSGIPVENFEDGYCGWITIDGEKNYCGITEIEADNAYVILAVPEEEIISSRNLTVGIVLFVAFIVLTIVVAYGILTAADLERNPVEEDEENEDGKEEKGGKIRYNQIIGRKTGSVLLIGLVAILAVSFYMQTLFSISNYSLSVEQRVKEIENSLKVNEEDVENLTSQYNRRYLNKALVASYILSGHEELWTKEDLTELSAALGVEFMLIFDNKGREVVSDSSYINFVISDDPESQSYEFAKLLQGVEYVVQDPMPDELSGEYHQYIGATLKDENGDADGFVQIAVEAGKMEETLAATEISTVLQGVKIGRNGFAFAVNKEDQTFSYYPKEKLIGRSALEYDLTEDAFVDGFSGFVTIQNQKYYASVLETDDDYVFAVIPNNEMTGSRIQVIVATGIACLVGLVLMFLILVMEKKEDSQENGEREGEADGPINIVMPDGTRKKTDSVASRWSNLSIGWEDKTPEQRVGTLLRGLLFVLALAICAAVLFKDQLLDENSVFRYVLEGDWQKGLNIFAVTACILVLCVLSVVTMVLRKLLKTFARSAGARGETLLRLLNSFVKYISVIAGLYYCFALFGVDTKTLLASAGILSLVIGLGAQSLVQDILAGLFLIFEGDFRVGDIVTVGSWRGTVVEIGIRTTKIEDASNDVKIFSNRSISDVINMTKKTSIASCDVGIEYGESIERVESILAKELPLMKERIPAILDGPFYKGITALADNSVNIKIVAQCREQDRAQLGRDLNREMKIIFDKYDVNIPFPQVVVNQPKEYQEATYWEKLQADKFNQEQKQLTKGIGNEDNEDEKD